MDPLKNQSMVRGVSLTGHAKSADSALTPSIRRNTTLEVGIFTSRHQD
jgi:hypothetical protein